MKKAMLCLSLVVVLAIGAAAQGTGKPEAAPPEDSAKEEAPAPTVLTEPTAPASPRGDILSFVNGRQLVGQVIKKTPEEFIVEVATGVELKVPRKQIQEVDYDTFEPSAARASESQDSAAPKDGLIRGKKVSAELYQKLTKPISDTALEYRDKGAVAILAELGEKLGVEITVDEGFKQLPTEDRLWGSPVSIAPGTTLSALLEEDLLKKLPKVGVVYQFDKIVVTSKEAAKTMAEEEDAKPADAAAKPDDTAKNETPAPEAAKKES
jgi:hypothetical protein